MRFQPMVCESTGAWSKEAIYVLGHMSRLAADATGGRQEDIPARSLQQTSVVVRSTTARALLRRLADS